MAHPAQRTPALALSAILLAGCHLVEERRSGAPRDRGNGAVEVAVHVERIAFDPASGTPVVLLEEDDGSRVLPILIPVAAARSIAEQMNRVTPPRPNTHDLTKRLLDGLDGEVERVIVTELRGGIFYALLVVRSNGRLLEIDARPSDAIAIALRAGAPLFVR